MKLSSWQLKTNVINIAIRPLSLLTHSYSFWQISVLPHTCLHQFFSAHDHYTDWHNHPFMSLLVWVFILWLRFPPLCLYFEGLVQPNDMFLTCLVVASIHVDFSFIWFEDTQLWDFCSQAYENCVLHISCFPVIWVKAALIRAVRMRQNSKLAGQKTKTMC